MGKFVILSICFLLLLSGKSFSQETVKDTLSYDYGIWGMEFKRGNTEISSKEFKQILKESSDEKIYALFSAGYTLSTIGDVFSFAGGFCVGYGLASKPMKTTLTIIGGVGIVGAIIIAYIGNKKMEEAVKLYNGYINSNTTMHFNEPLHNSNTIISFSFSL